MVEWKIISVEAKDGELITEARYFASVSDDENTVETEGNWFFQEPKLNVPFAEVTEEMVIDWIKEETTKDGVNSVESRLKEQLKDLAAANKVVAPWMPQVFTIDV